MTKSYNGWDASRDPKAIGVNAKWEPIPGHRLPGGIKSGDVEVVMTYVAQQLHSRVEPIDRDAVKDDWGYVFKQSANSPKLLSCHASATAFDWNATRHPNGRRGTFTPAQVLEIRKIQSEVGGVVRWLGDAKGTPDEMHFEIDGTPRQVAVVAERLSQPNPPTQEDDMPQFQVYEVDKAHPDSRAAWLVSPGCRPWEIDSTSRRDALTAVFGPVKKVSAEAWDGMKNALPERRG